MSTRGTGSPLRAGKHVRATAALVSALYLSVFAHPGADAQVQATVQERAQERIQETIQERAPGSGRNRAGETLSVEDLIGTAQLSGLSVSPDQAFAVVRLERQSLARNLTEQTWYRVRLRDGRVNRVCDGGEATLDINGFIDGTTSQWSADSKWIYFRGVENQQSQVWRCSADGARREQVTQSEADVVDFIVEGNRTLHVALEGATRAEILKAEQADYDSGVLMDKTTITGFSVVNNFPRNGRMVTLRNVREPTGRMLGRSTLLGGRPYRFVTMNLRDRSLHPASEAAQARFSQWWEDKYAFSYDASADEASLSQQDKRRARVVSQPTPQSSDAPVSRSGSILEWRDEATGRLTPCTARECLEADGLIVAGWTFDGRSVVFQTASFGTQFIYRWDTDTNTVSLISSGENELGSNSSGYWGSCRLAQSESVADAVCLASGADSPPHLIALDLRSGRQRVVFDPNAGLRERLPGVAQKVTLTDRWGGEAFGRLILPRSWLETPEALRPRLPLVLTSYTCAGFLLGGSGGDVPEHILAGMGYAALCLDLSSSGVRYAKDFDQRTQGYDQMVDFFEDAVAVLSKRGIADPGRVVVSGFSGSASGVTYALFKSQTFTAAIITTEAYLDPIGCYLNSAQGNCRTYGQRFETLPYDAPDGPRAQTSPAAHVAQIRTPLLMQLAEVEHRGMFQLHSAMLDYNRPVEMYVFADEYHYKRQPRHRFAVYHRNIDWIEFWLRGKERVGLDLKPQYGRWGVMRTRTCELAKETPNAIRPWYCGTTEPSVSDVAPHPS